MRLIILALTLFAGTALAAPTCSISPVDPMISPGDSVTWVGAYGGFAAGANPSPRWVFTGGSREGSGAWSSTVRYPAAGGFSAALRVLSIATREEVECSTMVTVEAQPPIDPPPPVEPTPVEPPPVVTPPIDVAVTIHCGEGVACTCTTAP